ncbi:hypothetical protein [Roseateles chitinivorans]|uniref:hypothetical protein n=1 Tax=Roseateles chitinivorans TaxID=2917965 RepID=UPI003D671EE8
MFHGDIEVVANFGSRGRLCTATLACSLLLGPVLGQEQPRLIAKRELSVLISPRNGLFCQRGNEIGKLSKGAEITHYEYVKSFCLMVPIEYVKFEYKTAQGEVVTAYVRRKERNGGDRFDVTPSSN